MKKSIPIIRERESEAFILGNGREREFPLTPDRIRQAQLEVIKFRTEEGLVYLTVSENRLLNTFYCMLSEPCINFGLEWIQSVISNITSCKRWESFRTQFNIYRRELARLLDEDEGCRGRYYFGPAQVLNTTADTANSWIYSLSCLGGWCFTTPRRKGLLLKPSESSSKLRRKKFRRIFPIM